MYNPCGISKAQQRRERKEMAQFVTTYKLSKGPKRDWEQDKCERRLLRDREDAEAMKMTVKSLRDLAMTEQQAAQWKKEAVAKVASAKALIDKHKDNDNGDKKVARRLCKAEEDEWCLSPYLDGAECGRKLSEARDIDQRRVLLKEMHLDRQQERFVEVCHRLNQRLPLLFPTMLKNRIFFRKSWLVEDDEFQKLSRLLP
jgi:hypothetical protein